MTTKLTQAELATILANFKGTTCISLHSITGNHGQFNEGRNGSRAASDKMAAILGFSAKDIRKEAENNYLLTSCPFNELVERALARQLDDVLTEMGISVEQFVEMIHYTTGKYELSERSNGEAVNGYLVNSAKDGAAMINVYSFSKPKNKPTFLVNGKEISADILAPFKSASYGKPSAKQLEFGLDPERTVKVNNFRLENVRHITMNKVRYEVVAG